MQANGKSTSSVELENQQRVVDKFFHVCPKCGSTSCGLTNPDDGIAVCNDCGCHVCLYQDDVLCSVNRGFSICESSCLRRYLTKEQLEKVKKEYNLPDCVVRGAEVK